jgi:hypothetical protein
MPDKDEIYTKIVAPHEVYNFIVLSFSFDDAKMLKKIL